ncbi:HAD family hydrolase [Pseudohalocynthiibacter aestuariivivens]|nr:HAD family hydrolase [Pseudohalocynthiibacter aestuariivivens]QIE46631.1 HAD family hydrolase [Pseudohalocynthiibacter aestuariivivens]
MSDVHPSKRSLLVLDIDETLIHGSEIPLDRPADFRVAQFHIYKRPHLAGFLAACAEWYDLGIWSSASESYVQQIAHEVFPVPEAIRFIWGQSRTTMRRSMPSDFERFGRDIGSYHYQKRLQKLKRFGWPLQRILLVDDSPEKCAANYGNAIYVAPFHGQEADGELPHLASYLQSLKDCDDYRRLEKRGWRQSSQPMEL